MYACFDIFRAYKLSPFIIDKVSATAINLLIDVHQIRSDNLNCTFRLCLGDRCLQIERMKCVQLRINEKSSFVNREELGNPGYFSG